MNLNLNYENYEIIVVNDGSTDCTLDKLIDYYRLYKIFPKIKDKIQTKEVKQVYKSKKYNNLTVIDKENGGKSDALNVGINYSKKEIICTVDADSILNKDSILKMNNEFNKNNNIVAIGGNIKLSNNILFDRDNEIKLKSQKNHLIKFQFIEYTRAFLVGRIFFSTINSLLVLSGAFASIRKNILLKINGFDIDTVGEDMELILRIHEYMLNDKKSYQIKYLHDAICWTQAPTTLNDLKKQRMRWQIGLMDSMLKHNNMLFNKKYKQIGLFGMPYFQFFEFYSSPIELIGYVVVIMSYFMNILSIKALYYYISIVIFGIFVTISSILLSIYRSSTITDKKESLGMLYYSIFENIGYRQIVLIYRLVAIFTYKKNKKKWEKIKRKKI